MLEINLQNQAIYHPTQVINQNYFISDLHLEPDQNQELGQHFAAFLHNLELALQVRLRCDLKQERTCNSLVRITNLQPYARLFIHGDLLNLAYADNAELFEARFVTSLRRMREDYGLEIYFMPGNRDFLLQEKFCHAIGAQLLPENSLLDWGTDGSLTVSWQQLPNQSTAHKSAANLNLSADIQLPKFDAQRAHQLIAATHAYQQETRAILARRLGWEATVGKSTAHHPSADTAPQDASQGLRVLLCHGDNLCLNDQSYLRFRKQIRSQGITNLASWVPSWFASSVANYIRKQSKQRLAQKIQAGAAPTAPKKSIDIDVGYTQQLLQSSQANLVILGHIHRQRLLVIEESSEGLNSEATQVTQGVTNLTPANSLPTVVAYQQLLRSAMLGDATHAVHTSAEPQPLSISLTRDAQGLIHLDTQASYCQQRIFTHHSSYTWNPEYPSTAPHQWILSTADCTHEGLSIITLTVATTSMSLTLSSELPATS